MTGFCVTCKHGSEQCDLRFDAGAEPKYVDGLGVYYECREWIERKEVIVDVVGIRSKCVGRSPRGGVRHVLGDCQSPGRHSSQPYAIGGDMTEQEYYIVKDNLWGMRLHDELPLRNAEVVKIGFVLRVPGGWIYTLNARGDEGDSRIMAMSSVFVPMVSIYEH